MLSVQPREGCPPYSLTALYSYDDGTGATMYGQRRLASDIESGATAWFNLAAPVNSSVTFQLADSTGNTLDAPNGTFVVSNYDAAYLDTAEYQSAGPDADSWCLAQLNASEPVTEVGLPLVFAADPATEAALHRAVVAQAALGALFALAALALAVLGTRHWRLRRSYARILEQRKEGANQRREEKYAASWSSDGGQVPEEAHEKAQDRALEQVRRDVDLGEGEGGLYPAQTVVNMDMGEAATVGSLPPLSLQVPITPSSASALAPGTAHVGTSWSPSASKSFAAPSSATRSDQSPTSHLPLLRSSNATGASGLLQNPFSDSWDVNDASDGASFAETLDTGEHTETDAGDTDAEADEAARRRSVASSVPSRQSRISEATSHGTDGTGVSGTTQTSAAISTEYYSSKQTRTVPLVLNAKTRFWTRKNTGTLSGNASASGSGSPSGSASDGSYVTYR